jgi:hypothetical protein
VHDKMKYVLAAFALAVFGILLSTAPSTVYLGDSGEMMSAAYCLGIGHPPGYPLHMLMTKIFTMLPLGDVAFRGNLLSITMAVLVFLAMFFMVTFMLQAVFKEKKNVFMEVSALLTACIFAFSYMFWFQAVQSKGGVYITAHLFELMGMLMCLKYIDLRKVRYFYLAAYLAGFLPAVHHSAALIMIFILVALLLNMQELTIEQMQNGLGLFLLSFFTPYLYLFIRARAHPVVCWGDIATAGQVLNHVIRKVYFNMPRGPFNMDVVLFKLRNFCGQFLYSYKAGVLFTLTGFVFLFLRARTLFYSALAFVILDLGALIYLTGYSYAPFNVYMNSGFYLLVDVVLLAVAGAGIYGLAGLFGGRNLLKICFIAVLFLLPVYEVAAHRVLNDQSRKFTAYDNANNDLRTLSDGDILFAEEDFQVFNLLYLKYVKHLYPGIRVYDRSANFLDTSIFEKFKDAGMESKLKVRASNQQELDFMMMQLTQRLERAAEYEVIMGNPGRVYYTSLTEFPLLKLSTKPYGILNKLVPDNKNKPDAINLMQIYTIRDYFNNGMLDLYYRDVLGRYFIQYAKYYAMIGSRPDFDFFRQWGENVAAGSGSVLNLISSIYFYDLHDTESAIIYMEQIMGLNRYDYSALDVLIRFCLAADKEKAVKWLNYYYTIAQNKTMQNNILVQLERLKDEKSPGPLAPGTR